MRTTIRHPAFRTGWLASVLVLFVAALGCDSSDQMTTPVHVLHPDTGVGAGETAPGTVNCLDLCLREADCAAKLCDEDTMTTVFDALSDELAAQCNTGCTAAPSPPGLSAAQWQCFFQ